MIIIDVTSKSKKWRDFENLIEKIAKEIIPLTDLKKILRKNFTLELSVSLVSDVQMKKINFQYRGKNKPTNVLSFPALDENLLRQVGLKEVAKSFSYMFLGDIVISFETVKKESLAQKKKFEDHLTHMILHSILHLLGYDHEVEKMAIEMEKLEVAILKKLRIKNPYQLIT